MLHRGVHVVLHAIPIIWVCVASRSYLVHGYNYTKYTNYTKYEILVFDTLNMNACTKCQ